METNIYTDPNILIDRYTSIDLVPKTPFSGIKSSRTEVQFYKDGEIEFQCVDKKTEYDDSGRPILQKKYNQEGKLLTEFRHVYETSQERTFFYENGQHIGQWTQYYKINDRPTESRFVDVLEGVNEYALYEYNDQGQILRITESTEIPHEEEPPVIFEFEWENSLLKKITESYGEERDSVTVFIYQKNGLLKQVDKYLSTKEEGEVLIDQQIPSFDKDGKLVQHETRYSSDARLIFYYKYEGTRLVKTIHQEYDKEHLVKELFYYDNENGQTYKVEKNDLLNQRKQVHITTFETWT